MLHRHGHGLRRCLLIKGTQESNTVFSVNRYTARTSKRLVLLKHDLRRKGPQDLVEQEIFGSSCSKSLYRLIGGILVVSRVKVHLVPIAVAVVLG